MDQFYAIYVHNFGVSKEEMVFMAAVTAALVFLFGILRRIYWSIIWKMKGFLMTNQKAKILQIVAAVNLGIGIIGGIVAGLFVGSISNSLSSMAASFSGSTASGSGGFNPIVMLAVWIAAFIQSAFIWGFAELIEQTARSAEYLERLSTPGQPQFVQPTPQPPVPPQQQYPPNPYGNPQSNYPGYYNR